MSDSDEEDPIIPCPCGTLVTNTFTIECNQCKAEWHLKCCGLSGLTKKPIENLEKNQWKCPTCFEPAIHNQQAKKSSPVLTQAVVENIVTIVNSTIEANLKQLLSPENLTEDTATVAEEFQTVQHRRREKSMQKVLEEQREEEILIEKKKDNLVIYGIPEPNLEDKKEEMLEDFRKLKKAYSDRVELKEEDIGHITRIGIKENNKIRPVQISLKSPNKRKDLLTKNMNLKLLENNISTNLYVSPDRTKKQREADKELRAELKRRKDGGEANLVIRSNKIVPFQDRAQVTQTWASLFA